MEDVLSAFETLFDIDCRKQELDVNLLNDDGEVICLKDPSHQLFDGAIVDGHQSSDTRDVEPNKENKENGAAS